MTWLPIDDPERPAPRDGTKVLAFFGGKRISVVYYDESRRGWRLDGDASGYTIIPPLMWTPLPPPPET